MMNDKRIRGLVYLLVTGIFALLAFSVQATNAPITTAATVGTAVVGQPVTVPITVTGFSNIGSFYLTLDYEYAKLHYLSGANNPALTGYYAVGEYDMGNGFRRITMSWTGSGSYNLPDGSYIVNLVFTYLSGPAPLTWFDMGPSCEYANPSAVVLNDSPQSTYYINGLVYQSIFANTKVLLEGPYSSGSMSTSLKTLGLLPLAQPYSSSPWNYTGTESVTSIPANITDWILVELRTGTASSTKVASRAGFIKNDGTITDLNGSSALSFSGIGSGNYYIVIRHRNHMPVMSASPVALSSSSALYDFTTGSSKAYGGTNGFKLIDASLSKWGMVSGDATNEGSIYIDDYTDFWVPAFGSSGIYSRGDFKLDGNVFIDDYTDYWVPNFGKSNGLP